MEGSILGYGALDDEPVGTDPKHKTTKATQSEPQTKTITIDWDNIPPQVLIPKLKKTLGYTYSETEKKGVFDVFDAMGGDKLGLVTYLTALNSCTCQNWLREGTSLNPCKHMVRVKYTDREIQKLLKKLEATELPAERKKKAISQPNAPTQPDLIIHSLTPRLAEVGKIKIGGKSEKRTGTGFLLPEKYDHFEIGTLLKDAEGRLVMDDEMNKKIGENSRELSVYLCYDSPELNMPTFYSWFVKSKLMCMGNGEKAMRTLEDGSKEERECNPKACAAYKEKRCKPYGRLSVILASASRLGGVYVFRTTSWNSIRNILSSMAFLRRITGGVLAGIPLRMTLLPMTVTPRDVGRNVKIYVVNIEYVGSPTELKQAAVEEVQHRMQLGMNMKQMEEIDKGLVKERVIEESEEESEDIAAEFAPEGGG